MGAHSLHLRHSEEKGRGLGRGEKWLIKLLKAIFHCIQPKRLIGTAQLTITDNNSMYFHNSPLAFNNVSQFSVIPLSLFQIIVCDNQLNATNVRNRGWFKNH